MMVVIVSSKFPVCLPLMSFQIDFLSFIIFTEIIPIFLLCIMKIIRCLFAAFENYIPEAGNSAPQGGPVASAANARNHESLQRNHLRVDEFFVKARPPTSF